MANERPLECLSVLVVEDEYFLADELKLILKAGGVRKVRLSGSIDDACEQAKTGEYALALVDINIRGDDAYPVADELQRRRVPFAFVTGSDRGTIPKRFAKVPLWRKPYDSNRIARDIETLWRTA